MSIYSQVISLNIDHWSANSKGLDQPEKWQQWAINNQWPDEGTIAVDAIPAMTRRRMSALSKLAVQTAIPLLNQNNIDYLVFSSRHGELHRSAQLIQDIVQGEEASPMAFSQSVHNTAAGLSTIITKKPIPLTSISAAENTFQSAILEAWSYLEQHPSHKVLLVDFDEPLPAVYQQYETDNFQGFSLGLVLSKGDDFSLTALENRETDLTNTSQLPQGLAFLSHFLSEKKEWSINADRQYWRWKRC
ncbi:3-oxoacyl-ACP synthase [Vibrio sp. MACH09]|uniref:beta-ketoacyl synthase chain length factor n=1 Tax=unclassified Vibrio TaxID=2614977 RepID=UPI001493A5CA|nr:MULTISPECIES: beta-ketoacyl synthase chain length factor [unclassified Vibrio]NOI68254.1 beta-ketoacyl synthase chain length factor [Vibrio sp. 99-8-1]GLO61990.1 3-oxoacyl-ACP synthase [Vibrio sp. MACH09]